MRKSKTLLEWVRKNRPSDLRVEKRLYYSRPIVRSKEEEKQVYTMEKESILHFVEAYPM
jgi:hypothetical protein